MARDFLQYRNHYVRDWQTSETVRLMSYAAQGIYQALLDAQWEKGSIPAGPETCARLLRCTTEEWEQFASFFETCFPPDADGRRRNLRMDEDRLQAQMLIQKKKDSAQKRWSKDADAPDEPKQPPADAPAMHPQCDRNASAMPAQCPTTTTTTTTELFTEVNNGDCSDEPSEDAPMPEPYGTVYRVLLACDDREPPESKVKRYLSKDSPIRGLVKQYGEADAIRLIKWAAKHKRVGVAVVYGNSGVWWQEANDCNWNAPPERVKKPGWGDPAEDIRKMTEDLIRG
jgi:uncharacterized protein YdaU (DUF1376 family)